MSVRIVDSLPELGGQLKALYPEKFIFDMPGFPKILACDLADEMIKQGLQFGAEVVLGEQAETLEASGHGYRIGVGAAHYETRSVLIAAGEGAFSPTKLGVAEEEKFGGKGVHYGVQQRSIFEGKRLMVIGGGDSAFDWALNLQSIASEVILVHRRDVFKAHEETVRQVQDSGIEMKLFRVVRSLHGSDVLGAVTLENTQTKEHEHVETDAVIVNIGFKSSLGPIKQWGLDMDRNRIVVDRLSQTNLPGVFAAGDVCTYEGKLKLIATGVGEAASAVCVAKTILDPAAKLFPGHSSDMDL